MRRPSQQTAMYEAWIKRDGQPPLRVFGNRPPGEAGADILMDAWSRSKYRKFFRLSQPRKDSQ